MDPDEPVALVTWQALCLDALDVGAQSRFWAAVAGLEVAEAGPPARLSGPTERHTTWVNEVDRPHEVKNRVHLDVDCAAVDELVALGARVLASSSETGFGWDVMADPEGNEFCAFVRAPGRVPAYRIHGIGIDCVDAERQARWWGDAFGVTPERQAGEDWWTLTGVAADARMTLDFAPVPEPRTQPNRVHWDVAGSVPGLLERGASRLWDGPRWTVLADPEGNEFCVFAPRSD